MVDTVIQSGTLDDDLAVSPRDQAQSATEPVPRDGNGLATSEVMGDAPPAAIGGEASAGDDDEVSSPPNAPAESDLIEASPEQMAASSAESAILDLTAEGYEEPSGTEAGALEPMLAEAGSELSDGGAAQTEFLGVLASLAPTLISTIGPAVAKGIVGKLSPRARRVVQRPRPAPPPGAVAAAAAPPDLLSLILRLLQQAAARPGGESLPESDPANAVIEEASAVLEVIIGRDDRIRVMNTSANPWRRVCALRIEFPTGATYRGTGFLIGARAIATAGHCVYLHSQGGWARRVLVYPGADGSRYPYGQAESRLFRSVGGWVNARKPQHDYGCIVLPSGSFGGANLGRFGFASLTPGQLLASPAVIAGYPGDKPFAELWGMARRIKSVAAKTISYDIDTMGGQSGAPVYIRRNGQRYVVGIHNYGASTGNSATRITPEVYRRLRAWSTL